LARKRKRSKRYVKVRVRARRGGKVYYLTVYKLKTRAKKKRRKKRGGKKRRKRK